MEKYDLCVIGGGPSGYAAAMRALDFNKKVILIEKGKIGGAGLYNGALSSKAFWEISRDVLKFNQNLAKYNHKNFSVDFYQISKEVNDAVLERKAMLENHLDLIKKSKNGDLFTLVYGSGKLLTENEIEIDTEDKVFKIYAENTILATGSSPRKLPAIPIDEDIIITSDGISLLKDFPESIVIVGAGVIGCEFATIFSNFGRTKVFLIDKGDRILPFEDEDVVKVIEGNLTANGVTIHRNSQLGKMEIKNGRVEYELLYNDGRKEVLNVEKALISVGRVPNINGLWSENVKIKLDSRGYIEDNDTQTSLSNIYAVGDITSDIALVNVGELEGRHAVEKIFSNQAKNLIYDNISTIMFVSPEVAGVGLNELQAKEKGISYKLVSLDYSCISRAIAMRNTKGFFKIIVTDDKEMKILGMRAVGSHASSAIQAVALLISMDKGVEELAELIHPHPSIIEGIQECVRMLLNKSILKPSIFTDTLKFRTYREGVYS